jgi:hypothetical protein
MDEQGLGTLCLVGQDGDRSGVDSVGSVRLALCAVDCRISCGIDEHFGPHRANDRYDPIWNREVQALTVYGDDFAERCKGTCELPADLPVFSDQQNLH